MRNNEFNQKDIEKFIEGYTPYQLLTKPIPIRKGFANENWLINTNQGKMVCKIGPEGASIPKCKAGEHALKMARCADIKTNQCLFFCEQVPLLKNRIVRIYTYIDGISPQQILPALTERFFKELGEEIHKLHQIKLDFFSSRVDGSKRKFGSWAAYLDDRIEEITHRALKRDLFDRRHLNQLWHQVRELLQRVNPYITASLTHRDLHIDNMISTSDGHLRGIIDFDNAEAWDPVCDFNRLKWWVFKEYKHSEDAFIKGYGNFKALYPYFNERLLIAEVIDLVNTIAQTEEKYLKVDKERLSHILEDVKWENPLRD